MRTFILSIAFFLLLINAGISQTCNENDPPTSIDYIRLSISGPQTDVVVKATARETLNQPFSIFSTLWIRTDANSHVTITQTNPTFDMTFAGTETSEYFGLPAGHRYTYFSTQNPIPFDPAIVFPKDTGVIVGHFSVSPPSGIVELVMTDILPPEDLSPWFYYRCAITFCLSYYKDNYIAEAPNLPLPITLTTFKANKINESDVKLDWNTSSEINSDYFAIERSQNGRDWTETGTVGAAGNSTVPLAYTFYDHVPELIKRSNDNTLYYKLRMVDLDGKETYSDIRVVHLGKSYSDHGFAIYPNPSTQFFNVDLTDTDATHGDLTLHVFDILGKRIIEKKVLGGGIELLDMQGQPTGLYHVTITQGYKVFQGRISKI